MDYEILPNVGHPRFGGDWHLARGGDLQARVWFRMAKAANGQWVCTEVDIDSARPITSSLLRSIPMSAIIEELVRREYAWTDRGGTLDLATGLREFYDAPSIGLTDEEIASNRETRHLSEEELELYVRNSEVLPARPKAGGRGPTDAELARFKAAYEVARQTDRRRAIQRTIDTLAGEGFVISRATANRWRERLEEPSP